MHSTGIMAGGGDFYARRPLEALKINPDSGVLRMSFVHYTHEDEIAQLIEALDRVIWPFAAMADRLQY